MRKHRRLSAGLAALAWLATAAPLLACCMVPRTYQGSIGQSEQEAVLIHHNGREELILKIHYQIKGKTRALPDRFAWVITVPSEPDEYAVADDKLFEEVFDWTEKLTRLPTRSAGARGASLGAPGAAAGIELGRAVKVGPYAIQPVRALGKEALGALNDWLEKNGFPTEDPKHMEYFVEKKFTFLCVKVTPEEGKKEVAPGGGLPPLHLSFKSETPYYPLRFSSRQGVFNVNLYVLTRKEFDYETSSDSLKRIRWEREEDRIQNVPVQPERFPKTLKAAFAKSAFKGDKETWHLNVLRARRVNRENDIASWKEDIFFRTRV